MNSIKASLILLLALVSVAPAQQQAGKPEDKPNVFLENDRPKKEKESNTRTIQGTVHDASDNPVAGAIVQLKDTKTSKIVHFATKEDGKFAFRDLSMAINYELVANRGELSGPVKKVSVYDTRKSVTLNFELTAAKQ